MSKRFLVALVLIAVSAAICFAIGPTSRLEAKANPEGNSVLLSWDAVSGAMGYNVYRKEASAAGYNKINFSPVSSLNYEDKAVTAGADYLYTVRALAADGSESIDSISVGAPLMKVDTSAKVASLRGNRLSSWDVKPGQATKAALPGDIISYQIAYKNVGFGSAKEANIDFDIPKGTVIASAPRIAKGPAAKISYFDIIKNAWVSKIGKEENVSKVRFAIPGVVAPRPINNNVNGQFDLSVVISL